MEPFSKGDPAIAQVVHQAHKQATSASASARAPYEMTAASGQIAPTVSDRVHEQSKAKTLQLAASIRAHMTDPTMNPADALNAEAEAWIATVKSTQSPLTEAHRDRSLAHWAALINNARPEISSERHWDRDIVEQNWRKHLFVMVNKSDRQKEKPLKASTVAWWASLFVHSIVVYTRDPTTHLKCGMALLIRHGVYAELKAQVVQLVHDFKLNRYKDIKIYYGRPELDLILTHMLEHTRRNGRQLVPVCGDITVIRRGYMDYEIPWRMKQFKLSIGTASSPEQNFNITGCLYTHNLLFDLTVPIIAHLFLLKRFKTKYATIAEFVADTASEIEIDPAFKDTPIFLAGAVGGREFAVPHQAAMAEATAESLRDVAQKCGLPGAGVTALRRDTGNMYALQLGTRIAKDILNHEADGAFRDSYSRNTTNYDLPQIRLGERAGALETFPGQQIEANLKRHAFKSYAVECLVRRARAAPQAEVTAKDAEKRKLEYKAKLVDREEFKPLDVARQAAWLQYLACFNATASAYDPGTASANRIFRLATGELDNPKGTKIPVAFARGWTEIQTAPVSFLSLVSCLS
ncbi:hypothetical protein DFH09DRAFT_1322780 [Mycena vulgaris]|nr:hypothetical protein DFH09DRAFT_1322780 [Mycena vulgaris]